MTTELTNLDIKTLVQLLTMDDMPHGHIIRLIARECNVPEDTFVAAVTGRDGSDKATRKNIKWTPEVCDDLVSRWNRGDKPRFIAEAMGCTTQVVYQRIWSLRKTRNDINERGTHRFSR